MASEPVQTQTAEPRPAPQNLVSVSADAPATLRAYRADWAHYAAWCADKNLVPVSAAPVTVGAYLASLGETHAPTTIRRRLSAMPEAS